MEGTVIKKMNAYCPHCGKTHAVSLYIKRNVRRVYGREYCLKVYAYYCKEAKQFFMTEAMRKDNEMRGRDAAFWRYKI